MYSKICLCLTVLGLLLCAIAPANAAEFSEPYGRWFGGDWVTEYTNEEGQKTIEYIRFTRHSNVLACVIYPNKETYDVQLLGSIISEKNDLVKIRWSTGYEIYYRKRGGGENTLLVQDKERNIQPEREFSRKPMPLICI